MLSATKMIARPISLILGPKSYGKSKKSINLTWVYENSSPVTEFITSPIVITIYCGNITKILIVFPRASSSYLILHFSPLSSTLKRSSIQKNQHVNLISNYKGSEVHNL